MKSQLINTDGRHLFSDAERNIIRTTAVRQAQKDKTCQKVQEHALPQRRTQAGIIHPPQISPEGFWIRRTPETIRTQG